MANFKGRKGLGRSTEPQKVRDVNAGKLAKIRGKEKTAIKSAKSFEAAAKLPRVK